MSIKNDMREVAEFLHSEFNSFTDLNAFEDRRKEVLDNNWWPIYDLVSELMEYKTVMNQLIGIPASVGIPEPIEGFDERPQDLLKAVEAMALKIESLSKDRQE